MAVLEPVTSKEVAFEHAEGSFSSGDNSPRKNSVSNGFAEVAADTTDNSIEDGSASWFVWLVAATASIAGSLFGYDTGIISAVLVYLGTSLGGQEATSNEKQLITSLCSGGAFIGSIIAGLTADKFGRKAAIYVGCLLFTVGAILQATAFSIAQMSVGRLVVGFGVGSAAMVV
jgi:MFS transporter, SP family, solute carrier family 2 (myo-inositol transporter), member 13